MIYSKTNLSEVKEVLKELFDDFDATVGDFGIVSHPFTNTPIVKLSSRPNEKFNLMDPEVIELWRKDVFNRIDALGIKDIREVFFGWINKPFLLLTLMLCRPYLKNSLFSELLANAWIRSEMPNVDNSVDIDTLIEWFKEADKDKLMEQEDKEFWDNIPDEIILYRGVGTIGNPDGLSWTDSREKAEWFRDRWEKLDKANKRYILTANVPKEYILCCFNSRNEREYIVDTLGLKKKITIDKSFR